MAYRIVQISKPYMAPVSYGGPPSTIACYSVGREEFETPEEAHKTIAFLCTGDYPNKEKFEKDWFIVIQTF